MLRAAGRILRTWLWAMYLVLIISCVTLIVISTRYFVSARIPLGPPGLSATHSASMERGELSFSWSRDAAVQSDVPPFRWHGPGFELTRETEIVSGWRTVHYLDMFNVTARWWLLLSLLILPLAAATLIRRRIASDSQRLHRPGVLLTLSRLAAGAALWLTLVLAVQLPFDRGDWEENALTVGRADAPSSGPAQSIYFSAIEGSLFAGIYHNYGIERRDEWTFAAAGMEITAEGDQIDAVIPLWMPFTLFALPILLSLIVEICARPYPPGCCPRCGYDLRGSAASGELAKGESRACPECGFAGAPRTKT